MQTEYRAILPALGSEGENARNLAGEKEEVNRLRVVVFDAAAVKETAARYKDMGSTFTERDRAYFGFPVPVDARFWMGRSSKSMTVYCSVWIQTRAGLHGSKTRYLSGRGEAGGCGYHKKSAALEAALRSAGVRIESRRVAHEGSERDAAQLAERPDLGRWDSASFGGAGDGAMQDVLLAVADAAGYRRKPRVAL